MALLTLVCVVSVSSALRASHGADVVDRSSRLDRMYLSARESVAAEASSEAAYSRGPSLEIRNEYNHAAANLSSTLEQLQRAGGPSDRRTARRIERMHREYLQVAARRFASIDLGATPAAQAADAHRTEELYAEVRAAVDAAAATRRTEAARSIAELRRSSGFVARWVPMMGVIGIILALLFTGMMIWYRRLVTQSAEREIARLERAALVDNLTGLHNHRALHEELHVIAERLETSATATAVVAIDLVGLKEANDLRGHRHGDELIRRVADGLRATVPAGGSIFRIGGGEFVVILEDHAAIDAFHYSQKLQTWLAPPASGIHAREVEEDFEPVHVVVGVSELGPDGRDGELALQRADLALIEAKRLGHNGLIWSAGVASAASTSNQTPDQRRFLAMALAKAVDAKDSYTRSHCETVAQLCVLIAEQLDLDVDDIERLRIAGLMHDVGKIGIPDAILQKPGRLTDEEFDEMRSHSTLGASIVAAAQLTEESAWVRHHHERIDGCGYPDRLEGDQIPLQSRIIFVADAFEAITSDRPYRSGRPAEEALAELRRCAGTQFDPDCVAALERALTKAGPNAVVPASVVSPPRRLYSVADDVTATDAERRAA